MTDDVTRTALSRGDILLTDKVAFITGGGAGIGRGIAVGLAEFGADVAILDRNAEAAETVAELVRQKGRRALTFAQDARDRPALREAIAETARELGGLDILVNNVGGTRPIPLVDITDEQADKFMQLNLASVVAASSAAAQVMIAQGRGGSIINIASIEALRAAPTYAVYAACKAGMVNFTRTAALELSAHGVRVNAIAPDLVPTEFMVRLAPDRLFSDEARAAQARYIPLGRPANFDDCAGAAVFLASPMASYITGVCLSVDGGTAASSGWLRAGEDRWSLQG